MMSVPLDPKLSKIRRKYSVSVQINQPTRCNNSSSLLLDVYLQLIMFHPPQITDALSGP